MYYRRSKKPLVIAILVFILVIGLTSAFSMTMSAEKEKESLPETRAEISPAEQTETGSTAPDAGRHKLVVYNSGLCSVTVIGGNSIGMDKAKTIYEVVEDEDVELSVVPLSTESFLDAEVLDGNGDDIPRSVKRKDDGTAEIGFVMPGASVFVNLSFGDPEESQKNGLEYALVLEEVPESVKRDFKGKFNAVSFLNSLGSSFAIGTAGSIYSDVKEAAFVTKPYTGDAQQGHIYHYLIFNGDDEWLILSDYDLANGVYLFRDIRQEKENEAQAESEKRQESEEQARRESEEAAQRASEEAARRESEQAERRATGDTELGSNEDPFLNDEPTKTEPEREVLPQGSSFSIDNIPTAFTRYVGGKEGFFQKVYGYVLASDRTGDITGTFESYKINKGKHSASFTITLDTGGKIEGKYSKDNGEYSFSGL
ncbi:MAG: hypothetical protein K2P21_08455 [Lachnospiraceae bacterium]|nr:hypothetical protein [Lachnospiraceae bacterium]